jgi:hypothetical protein
MGYGKCSIEALIFACDTTAANLHLVGMQAGTLHEVNMQLRPSPFELVNWRKVRGRHGWQDG